MIIVCKTLFTDMDIYKIIDLLLFYYGTAVARGESRYENIARATI